MSKLKSSLLSLLILISTVSGAQTKWYQQKRSTIPTAVNIDGIASFPRNESGGMIIDFDNDGLKDFIVPTYFSPQGNYDVQYIRFLKNVGNGQFKDVTDQFNNPDNSKISKFLVGINDRRGVVLDYNKDGKMDFIFPSAWENQDYSTYESLFGFTKMKDFYYKSNPSNYVEYRAGGGFQSPSFYYQTNGTFKRGYNLFDTKTFTADSDVETEDLNNDGWPDIVISQSGYKMNSDYSVADWLGGITIWMNDAGNGFKFNHMKLVDSINKYTFGFQDEGKVGIADMNGDGFKDLLIYGIKTPYKPRADISLAQQDSVLWDANYITRDSSRTVSYESRIYFSNRGVFEGANYAVVNNLRATFPMGVDLNNDGKNDILAVWKNYRAGGPTGVYTDSITNKNGINNQYYAFINKGNNQFEDQTASYFPKDNYKFSQLGRGDFYYLDIDGDGKNDFIPISMGDDTLGNQYGSFAIDPVTSKATVYYKNTNNSNFQKTTIDTLISNQGPEYYLNKLYIDDLNKDGVNDLVGFSHWNIAPVVRCQTPILDSYIKAVCGTDTLITRTIKVTNYNLGDSIFWNYNGTIIKANVDSFRVKEFGWAVAVKKDASGCISFSSDTLYVRRSPKPSEPRVYSIDNSLADPHNICKGEFVNLSADPQSLTVAGTILWFDKSKKLDPSAWGGVRTIYENSGTRNITTSSKIQIDTIRNVYTRFLSDDGCLSDTSNYFTINFRNITPPVLTKDANNNLTTTSSGKISWYLFGVMLSDTTDTIKLTSSGSYTALSTDKGCPSKLSSPYVLSLASTPISQSKWYRGSQIDLRGEFYKTLDESSNYYYGSASKDQTLGLGNWFSLDKSIITDFNKDGFDDLIITSDLVVDAKGSQGIQFLRFFQNTGNNNFKEVTKSMSSNLLPIFNMSYNLNLFDYDKDGITDIFSFGSSEEDIMSTINIPTIKKLIPNNFITVNNIFSGGAQKFIFQRPFFYTSNNGKYKESSSITGLKDIYFLFNSMPGGGSVIDYNNDGFSDIVIAGSSFIKYDSASGSASDLINGNNYSNLEQSVQKLKNGFIILKNESGKNGLTFNQGVDLSDNVSEKRVGKVYRPFEIRPDAGKNVYVVDFNNDGYNDMLLTGTAMNMLYQNSSDSIYNNGLMTNKSHEARIYINNKGIFSSTNYIVLANFSYTAINLVDFDNDGKVDIIGMVPISRNNNINDTLSCTTSQVGVYKNAGEFVFQDVSTTIFPKEKSKKYIIDTDNPPGGRNNIMTYDIDKDGFVDLVPLSYRNDCYILNGKKSSPCIDFGWYNDDPSSFYYRNIGGTSFEKVTIGKYFSKNVFNEQPFFTSKSNDLYTILGAGQNGFPKSDSLLNQLYATNKIIPHDFNNDGKTDFLSLNPKSIKFSELEFGGPFSKLETLPIIPWPDNSIGAFVISQCESPKFDKALAPICGTDSLKPFTLTITNIQSKDSIFWITNGKLDIAQNKSKLITDSGWVYAYKKDSTGCISYGDTLFVNRHNKPPIPKLYTMGGNLTFCQGDSLMVYADPSAANGYIQWYKNDTAFQNLNFGARAFGGTGSDISKKGSFAIKESGTYRVKYITNEGCISDDAKNDYTLTIPTITVVPTPLKSQLSVSKDTAICSGTNFSVKSSITTGIQWFRNNQLVTTANTGSLLVDTTGYYKVVTLNSSTSCKNTTSDSVFMKINPTPTAPTLTRDTANYLVASINGITWYKDGTILTDTTQKFKPSAVGSYTVKTTQNGCVSIMSNPYYFLVTDIIQLSNGEFIKLAPNPFVNQLNLDFNIKGYQKLNMEVYEMTTGKWVYSSQALNAGTPISLGVLAPGTYIIKFTSNDNKIVQQFKMVKM